MKKLFLLSSLFAYSVTTQAQTSCAGDTAARLSGNSMAISINVMDTTPAPVFTATAIGLPNTDFVVSNLDIQASDGLGGIIAGTTSSGRIVPGNFGLYGCNYFSITPVSYDLQELKMLTHAILTGNYTTGITCCQFIGNFQAGLCDSLHAAGIYDSSDVNNLGDFIGLIGAFAGGSNTFSIGGVTGAIDLINGSIGFLGACNGGVSSICYAVDTTGDDFYITNGSTTTGMTLSPATNHISVGGGVQIVPSFTPADACQRNLTWSIVNNPTSASVSSTGFVTGNSADTVWVVATLQSNSSITDTVEVMITDTVVGVKSIEPISFSIQLQPNPFQQQLQAICKVAQYDTYQVRMLDITGQVVLQQNYNLAEGSHTITFSTETLAAGVYIVQFQNTTSQSSHKVVKY